AARKPPVVAVAPAQSEPASSACAGRDLLRRARVRIPVPRRQARGIRARRRDVRRRWRRPSVRGLHGRPRHLGGLLRATRRRRPGLKGSKGAAPPSSLPQRRIAPASRRSNAAVHDVVPTSSRLLLQPRSRRSSAHGRRRRDGLGHALKAGARTRGTSNPRRGGAGPVVYVAAGVIIVLTPRPAAACAKASSMRSSGNEAVASGFTPSV